MPPPMSNCMVRKTARSSASTETANATCFARAPRRKISETAPTAGSRASTVRIGKPISIGSSAQPAQDEHDPNKGSAHHHGQGVGSDEAVLYPPQLGRQAADRGSSAIDGAIYSVVLQPQQIRSQSLSGPHEHRLVDDVTVEILAAGPDQQRAGGGLLGGDLVPRTENPHGKGSPDGNHGQREESHGGEVQQAGRLDGLLLTADRRIQPPDDPAVEEHATHGGTDTEHDQRNGHDGRRFVRMDALRPTLSSTDE